MRSKKEYVIGYTGLFESGYVIITLTGKHNSIRKYNNPHDLKKDATRFASSSWLTCFVGCQIKILKGIAI